MYALRQQAFENLTAFRQGTFTLFAEHKEPVAPAMPQAKAYDLGYGHLGNGITVWNRLEEEHGDYKTVAHIAPDRTVTIYDEEMPQAVREEIQRIADTSEMTISVTQDAPVFAVPPRVQEPPQKEEPADPYPELAARFMEHYNAGVERHCPAMANAAATLAGLQRRGWQQAVLSASRRDYLIEQVCARGLEDYFTELLGLQDIYGVSKVQVGKDWLRNSGVDPAACVMVGDTTHDAEVAAAMGTKCVLCTSGHQSRARLEAVCAHVIGDISQLPGVLETL